MKKLFTSVFFLLSVSFVFGQEMTKEEKKRIKKMSVEQIFSMQKNLEKKSEELKKVASEKDEMQALVNTMSEELNKLKAESDSLKALSVKQAEEQAKAAADAPAGLPKGKTYSGTYYKIQMGAYTKKSTSKLGKAEVEGEMVENQMKYVIGYFTDYKKAEAAVAELREMGLKDAWIVTYKDGKRVSGPNAPATPEEQPAPAN